MRGWHRDNYRHALAAKGITTRRYAFVANSKKGPGKKNPQVYEWSPEHGRYINKIAQLNALGISTGTTRERKRVGDTLPINLRGSNVTGYSGGTAGPYGMDVANKLSEVPFSQSPAGIPSYYLEMLKNQGPGLASIPEPVSEPELEPLPPEESYLPPNIQQAQIVESAQQESVPQAETSAAPLYNPKEAERQQIEAMVASGSYELPFDIEQKEATIS
jgi:hypothetical protein